MSQSSTKELFLNSGFPQIESHCFQPFQKGGIDLQLPVPNTDIRLFIFRPVDYPYLWMKYLSGLKREYRRMQVSHILDLGILSDPKSADLAILAIDDGEIVSGIRFHKGLKRVEDTAVFNEMSEGNLELLKDYFEDLLPDGVVESKGLWLTPQSKIRKRVLQLMARCVVHGTALLDCRYSICTSPKNMTRVYVANGMKPIDEIGTVKYPTDEYTTTFGNFDLHQVLDLCEDNNRILIRREWQKIHFTRLHASSQKIDHRMIFRPVVLDEGNPFHSTAIESLLLDSQLSPLHNYNGMIAELQEILPSASEKLIQETKRWVIYPWQNLATEIVGPKSYKKIRTDRNRNKITEEEQQKLAKISVGVVGLSTGHVIAHTLVMEGVCGHIKLADFDVLELSNLNRIPASMLNIGVNKAVITARRIAELDPYVPVEVFDQGVSATNIEEFMQGLDVVVEVCDSLDVKVLVREVAIKLKIPVLMATSDLGMMDVERFDTDENPLAFHGLTEVSAHKLKGLSRRDKSGYALAILEGEKISARLAASMVEIDHTVSTWSQLASDVTQGAAMAVTAVRRIGTGKDTPSSRIRMDIDECFEAGEVPKSATLKADQEIPAPRFSEDLKADMLLAANFSPSPGNIQPWKIYWKGDSLHLEIDRERTTNMDVKWRGAMVAIGAACFSAEVVAAHHAQGVTTQVFPSTGDTDLIAIIRLDSTNAIDHSIRHFYPYLLERITNRELTTRQALSADVMTKLASVCKAFPVKLKTISSLDQLNAYCDISIESDRYRHLSTHLHEQMMQELVWPGKDSLETGIDVRTLGLEEKDMNVLPLLARRDVMDELASRDEGKALGEYNKDRILQSSAIVVPTIVGDSDGDYFTGGKALQHFWLTAVECGLEIQPVSPVFLYANSVEDITELMCGDYISEVTSLKRKFNHQLNIENGSYPVLVMRVTYAPRSSHRSLRRPFDSYSASLENT